MTFAIDKIVKIGRNRMAHILTIGLIGFVLLTFNNCGGPIRNFSYQIREGGRDRLNNARSVNIRKTICQDSILSKAVNNLIIQELLPTNLLLQNDSTADIQIDLTITLASDMASGGSAFATHNVGSATFANSAGSYISGITAQITQSNNLMASATVSQSRTTSGIPDAPEEISRLIARKIICILTTKESCDYYY